VSAVLLAGRAAAVPAATAAVPEKLPAESGR